MNYTVKVKAHELRTKGKADLLTQLSDLKTELSTVSMKSNFETIEMIIILHFFVAARGSGHKRRTCKACKDRRSPQKYCSRPDCV